MAGSQREQWTGPPKGGEVTLLFHDGFRALLGRLAVRFNDGKTCLRLSNHHREFDTDELVMDDRVLIPIEALPAVVKYVQRFSAKEGGSDE